MVSQHHQLNRHEFEQTPGDSEGQESLACYSPLGCKELDMTERLNNKLCHYQPKTLQSFPTYGDRTHLSLPPSHLSDLPPLFIPTADSSNPHPFSLTLVLILQLTAHLQPHTFLALSLSQRKKDFFKITKPNMRFGYLSPVSGFSPTVSTSAQSQASGSPAHSGIWTLLLSLQIYILPSFCLMCKPFASATRNTLFWLGSTYSSLENHFS